MNAIVPNEAQQIRDAGYLRSYCAACGHRESVRNPLVLAADGYRVHVSHVTEPGGGYYGIMFFDEARPDRITLSSAPAQVAS